MRLLLCLPLFAVLFAATPASADDMFVGGPCAAAADCPLAFTCESVKLDCESGGDSSPQVCACPGCADGEECPPCDCDPEPIDDAPDCTPTVEQRCVFAPQDCAADADCTTAGFTCHLQEECSGSGGVDGGVCPPCDPDGGDCPPCEGDEPVEEEECRTTGGYCLPPEQACATDEDCGNGWDCADIGGSGRGDVACGCECRPCAAGEECPSCECEPCDDEVGAGGVGGTSHEGMCLPPGWATQIEQAVGGSGDFGSEAPRDASGDGAENGGISRENDAEVSVSACSTAGAGAGTSIFFAAAALALALRRR